MWWNKKCDLPELGPLYLAGEQFCLETQSSALHMLPPVEMTNRCSRQDLLNRGLQETYVPHTYVSNRFVCIFCPYAPYGCVRTLEHMLPSICYLSSQGPGGPRNNRHLCKPFSTTQIELISYWLFHYRLWMINTSTSHQSDISQMRFFYCWHEIIFKSLHVTFGKITSGTLHHVLCLVVSKFLTCTNLTESF